MGDAGQKSSEFEIQVADPVKQGEGVGAYVSYKIRTKTSMSHYKSSQSEVIRRFRDFSWLFDKLHEKNKGVIIPPLPEKNAVQKYQMSTEFIDQRRRALEVFINRVACHPTLKYSPELQMFLEAQEDVWQMEVARMNLEEGSAKKKVNATMQFFKDVQHKATNLMAGKSDDEQEDPEYLKVREYINHLENHLVEAHRQASRLIRKQGELGMAVGEFGQAAEKLGKFEEGSLQDAFMRLGTRAGDLSTTSRESSQLLSQNFEAPLKEFTRIMKSVKAVMIDRSNALSLRQQAKTDLDKLRVKLNKLKGRPGIREDQVNEMEREVDAADLRLRNAKEGYEKIVEKMSEEMGRFQRDRAGEMSMVLRDFALAQAQLASESAKGWSALVSELQPTGA